MACKVSFAVYTVEGFMLWCVVCYSLWVSSVFTFLLCSFCDFVLVLFWVDRCGGCRISRQCLLKHVHDSHRVFAERNMYANAQKLTRKTLPAHTQREESNP